MEAVEKGTSKSLGPSSSNIPSQEPLQRRCPCGGYCDHKEGQALVERHIYRLLRAKRHGDNVDDFILDRPKNVYTGDKRIPLSSPALGKCLAAGSRKAHSDMPKPLSIKKGWSEVEDRGT